MNFPINHQNELQHFSTEQGSFQKDEWIAGRILTLLSHFWREDDPIELTAAIAADWVEILRPLSQSSIEKGCLAYLQNGSRAKPVPTEIYKLASKFEPARKFSEDDFKPNYEIEEQCVLRIENKDPFSTWPRHEIEYMTTAKGGANVKEQMISRKGWYRPGGPHDRLGGKQVTA